MKKIFTLSVCILLFAAVAKPQTMGGPDAFGYIWRTSLDSLGPVYNWIDLDSLSEVTDVTPSLVDDNMSPYAYQVKVPFHFYWYDPQYFWVGANGFIAFNNRFGIADPFDTMPHPGKQDDYIAAMGADLIFKVGNPQQAVPGAECKFWYSPSFDSLIVMWKNVPFFDQTPQGYSGNNSFEMILTSVDSSITFQYKDQSGVYLQAVNFMTSGIEDISGGIGLQYQYDLYPTPGLAVKYYYPGNVTLSVNDASTDFTGNLGTKGLFKSSNSTPYISKADIKNTGNTTLSPFNVWSRILNFTNGLQVRDTVLAGTLAPGQTQFIVYPKPWTPTVPGVYRQMNVTLLSGDAAPSNDEVDLEIQVVDTTQASITLAYDNILSSGVGVLSWTGGLGGAANHFVPPFYPCQIDSVDAYVVSDINNVGYSMQVFLDNGISNGPGTFLDSVFVAPGTFVQGQYNPIALDSSIRIDSGGFYVAWMMGGDLVQLGTDLAAPFSHQSWEITGPAYALASWTGYRSNDMSDLMIHAMISSVPVSVNDINSPVSNIGNFFPNPASHKTIISYTLKERANVSLSVYNINGQLVDSKSLGMRERGNDKIELNVQPLNPGVYMCKITAGDNEFNRKIVVVK